MTEQIFKLAWATLVNAFPSTSQNHTVESQRIYWHDLKEIPDKQFEFGVDWCRRHCKFFPTIAEIGKACYGTEDWHEHLAESRRLAFKREQKKIDDGGPRNEQERQLVRQSIKSLADSLGSKMNVRAEQGHAELDKACDRAVALDRK